jgi:hypothetical protein
LDRLARHRDDGVRQRRRFCDLEMISELLLRFAVGGIAPGAPLKPRAIT